LKSEKIRAKYAYKKFHMEDVDDRHIMEEEDHGWNEMAD
jgi:hypothetical protein